MRILSWTICVCAVSFVLAKRTNDKNGGGHENEKHEPHWAYSGEYYPPNWYKLDERCRSTNERQSPINIDSTLALYDGDLEEINLMESHSRERRYPIVNNGHSVNIEIPHSVSVMGGALPSNGYKVAGIHFHWGVNDIEGSEHTVNDKRFPLEMHMVTYDAEKYSTLGDAVFGDNSLAVLGTMFNISEDDNPVMGLLINYLEAVYDPGQRSKIRAFPISRLLPPHTDKYFRYLGSLTTPPCAQSVVWTLFLHVQTISSKQLSNFRDLVEREDSDGVDYIENNWRPIQPIHKRHVYRSFLYGSEISQAMSNYGASESDRDSYGSAQSTLAGVFTIMLALLSQIL